MEEKAAELEAEEQGPIDKNALYEKVRQPEKRRVRVSKISRMLESEQLKNAREEVARVREETVLLRRMAEESVRKAEEAVNQLAEFQENMIAFQRDMAFMRRAMHANGQMPIDSDSQGNVSELIK